MKQNLNQLSIYLHEKRAFFEPLFLFIISRIFIFLLLFLSSQIHFTSIPAREGVIWHLTLEKAEHSFPQTLKKILLAADASWYMEIAKHGYNVPGETAVSNRVAKNWVFFPLFPITIKLASLVFGNFLFSALLVANLAFFISLLLLYKLVLLKTKDQTLASRSVCLLAFFPTSYFCSAPFTEPLFLALILGAFLLLHQRKPVLASVLMSFSCMTRPIGFLLMPAFLLDLHKRQKLSSLHGILSSLIAPTGGLVFMVYLYHLTGDPIAFSHNQVYWGRLSPSISGLIQVFSENIKEPIAAWNFVFFNFVLSVSILFAAASYILKRNYVFALILAVPILVALSTGTVQSIGRIALVLFPLYICLSQKMSSPLVERIVIIIFSIFLTLMVLMYGAYITSGMA